MTTTQTIKDIEKGCGEKLIDVGTWKYTCGEKTNNKMIYCQICKAKLQATKEAVKQTAKEVLEIIPKIIDEVELEVKKDLEISKFKRDEKGIVSGTCRCLKTKLIQALTEKEQKLK